MLLRLLFLTAARGRCPCCGEGAVFDGWLHTHSGCSRCGLVYDQWVGEWITPTYLASTAGMLVGFGICAWLLFTGRDVAGSAAALLAAGLGSLAALLALRPSKGAWLGFLYWVGAVEVSARTRALLRWEDGDSDPARRERLLAAEERARSPSGPPAQRRGGGPVLRLRSLGFLEGRRRRPRKPGRTRPGQGRRQRPGER